jgi:hypothetical protein
MKMARIVIISGVLLTAAITVGDANEKPVSSAVIRAAACCDLCPPVCPNPPNPPSQTH